MVLIRSLFCAAVLAAPAHAQLFRHTLSASASEAAQFARAYLAVPETVHVLAVMVQFQPDNDVRTSGNGRFLLTATSDTSLDAPPHGRLYFQNHCTFLENYFRKVSKGKVVVQCAVLDSVLTLREPMANFAPPQGGSNAPLFDLARETWHMVDSSGLVPSFSSYQSFVIFHAGVGHDVDLVSTLGYDPSPSDIPSLYLGPHAWGAAGGGVLVNGGAYRITNTIIMPETESRSLPGISGEVQLVLGINGLFCASFGNYLGLPDLFNTKTGRSGIGRFGLMDGESIFSFSGAFPPEPSAWEKYWLGWVSPVTVGEGTTNLSLPAVGLADTIYRVPISDGEYFLLENRYRDAGQNGQRVTSVLDSVVRIRTFARDTTGFNAFDISGLAGTVTDVEDMDWSLPGGVGEDGTIYNGGMLLWHVDESVIRNTISSNGVNADPAHRGVDLEEADGSQDIGQQYDQFTPGSGSEQGTAIDFWFRGNPSPVYANSFSAATFPNSNSNAGASSHITIDNFSALGLRMTVRVSRGDAISPLAGFPRQTGDVLRQRVLSAGAVGPSLLNGVLVGTSGIPLPQPTTDSVLRPLPIRGRLFLLPTDSASQYSGLRPSGVIAIAGLFPRGFNAAPAVADLNGDGSPEIVAVESGEGAGSAIRVFSVATHTFDSLASEISSIPIPGVVTLPPVVADSLIVVGNDSGTVFFCRIIGNGGSSIPGEWSGNGSVTGISRWRENGAFIVTFTNGVAVLTKRNADGTSAGPSTQHAYGSGARIGAPAVGLFPAGRTLIAFTTSAGEVYLVDSALTTVPGFPVATGSSGPLSPPALADIDRDGSRDLVTFGGSQVFAYNAAGALLDHFPVSVGGVISSCSPVIGDVDGDGIPEIVGVTDNGIAFAVNGSGRSPSGWPLAVGTGDQSLALISGNGWVGICASSGDGSVSAWRTGVQGSLALPFPWAQWGNDAAHAARVLSSLGSNPISSEFFPLNRVYNWPNPVYDNLTHFRFYVKENAAVHIKVFNVAGELVTELSGQGIGGVDNEIVWNASGVQSGVYFARVEAAGQSGSGVAIVKVAVVK